MAPTVLTIEVSEAEAARVINALCDEYGLARSGANARSIVVQLIRQAVEAHERRGFAPPPVPGVT